MTTATTTTTPSSSCKWTRKHSHYVTQGHVDACPKSGTSSDLFADLEDAKAACLKAGDCVAVVTQTRLSDICHRKWRVVHSLKPEWKHMSGGITHQAMDAYEASPECLKGNAPPPASFSLCILLSHTNVHASYEPLSLCLHLPYPCPYNYPIPVPATHYCARKTEKKNRPDF